MHFSKFEFKGHKWVKRGYYIYIKEGVLTIKVYKHDILRYVRMGVYRSVEKGFWKIFILKGKTGYL